MDISSIESLLHTIEHGLNDLNDEESIVRAIDQFQQDPLTLDHKLPQFIELLTQNIFDKNESQMASTALVFYTFSKVCTVRKIMNHLKTDIYLLPGFLELLQRSSTDYNWHVTYMALAWVNMLVMSPFKLHNDNEIFHATAKYKSSQVLHPVVSSLHSELFVKNHDLFLYDVQNNGFDLYSLNFTLKSMVHNNQAYDIGFLGASMLNNITSFCFESFKNANESECKLILKILPKICKLYALGEEWEQIEDIVTWFLNNLNTPFTELRFKLARNFAKIVLLIHQLSEEMSTELVDMSILEVLSIIHNNSMETVDGDVLHVLLLIIAEFARCKLLSPKSTDIIVSSVIPYTILFQQLRITKIHGHQVRDATNFICWSMTRNCNISANVESLFLHLLMCSMVDHDLIIRKSANAALQELLGRYGHHILDDRTIVEIIELPVGNLHNSFFQNLSTLIDLFHDKYGKYLNFVLDWVIKNSILCNHDLNVAKLASKALSSLLQNIISKGVLRDRIHMGATDFLAIKEHQSCINYCKLIYLATETKVLEDSKQLEDVCFKEFSLLAKRSTNSAAAFKESFIGICFVKYINYMLIGRETQFKFSNEVVDSFFHIVRSVGVDDTDYEEMKTLCLPLISVLSSDDDVYEEGVKHNFEINFRKFLKFNNALCAAGLAYTTSFEFSRTLEKWCPHMNCESRSQLLNSLTNRLHDIVMVGGNKILFQIVQLLDDYTITNQGDIGRLVRTSAAKAIDSNFCLFMRNGEDLMIDASQKLLRLAGEPLEELRLLSFSILCRTHNYTANAEWSFNRSILHFQQEKYNSKNQEFWKGYLTSAGAVHSTEQQITSSIDCFLAFYESLTECSRNDLVNDLVRIIPNATMLKSWQQSKFHTNSLGCQQKDLVKQTITCLLFWQRILESNISLSGSLNFEGFYARIYNLHLLKSHSAVIIASIQLLTLIALKAVAVRGNTDYSLVNNLIKRLWKLANVESGDTKNFSNMQQTSITALATIYLETQEMTRANLLQNCITKGTFHELSVEDLLIN